MGTLLRLLTAWSVRRILMFVLIVIAMVAFLKVKEAYDRVPALKAEIGALEEQQALLRENSRAQMEDARAALARIEQAEAPWLQQRLANVRAEMASPAYNRMSNAGYAMAVVRGDTGKIAQDLAAGFRLQLLRREEAAIQARLDMIAGANRANGLAARIRALDQRIAALEARKAAIERRHPLLNRVQGVPVLRDLWAPWQEMRRIRQELDAARSDRANSLRALQATQAFFGRARGAYQQSAAAVRDAVPPGELLEERIGERREALSQHWASRAWQAVQPVLGWALWLTILIIIVPPAVKAFWFFVVAPVAARLPPIRIRPELAGDVHWAADRLDGPESRPGSAVSRRLLLRPGEELLVRPEYLQSSMNDARIDSVLLLSWAIPFGSLATGLVGLTRIRVDREAAATVSSSKDPLDEVGIVEVPEGAALVFHPRNLIGLVQRSDRPMRLERVWRLRDLSSWLTLKLRYLVFHGPCALIVKGARGAALEPAENGRRIAGAATMGWSAGLGYSVRRSETFLAYLTGKQSLFNDSFEGERGKIVYEEFPRAGVRGGLLGRGLEGLGDAMLKIVGL